MKKHVWSKKEISYLMENYPTVDGKFIANELGLTYAQVAYQARKLNIKKDISFLRESAKRLELTSLNTRFKKGQVSFNKGLKQTDYMSAEAIKKTAATRFIKGVIPHNSLPVGTEVVRLDKRSGKNYTLIKLEGSKKLIYKHLHLYESYHKIKLQKGYNVVFKDGNNSNFNIDNLECISNEELMHRNTIRRYPIEVVSEMIKIGKLKRIIKKIENGKGKF
jgi:hypothetical protein